MLLADGGQPVYEVIEKITPTVEPIRWMEDVIATPSAKLSDKGVGIWEFISAYWMYGIGIIIIVAFLYWLIKKLLK